MPTGKFCVFFFPALHLSRAAARSICDARRSAPPPDGQAGSMAKPRLAEDEGKGRATADHVAAARFPPKPGKENNLHLRNPYPLPDRISRNRTKFSDRNQSGPERIDQNNTTVGTHNERKDIHGNPAR
jgi:hypothetical protein